MSALVELLGGFEERPRALLHGGKPLAKELHTFLVHLDDDGRTGFQNEH